MGSRSVCRSVAALVAVVVAVAVVAVAVAGGAVAGGSTAPAPAWERENGPEVKREARRGQPPAGVHAEHWVRACMGELGERTRIRAVAPAAAGAQMPSPGLATVP